MITLFNLFTASALFPFPPAVRRGPLSPYLLCLCAGGFLLGMRLPSGFVPWDLTLSGTTLWFIVARLTSSDTTAHLLDATSSFT